MRYLSLICAVSSCALPVIAQNCVGTPPSATILTQSPFGASFYVPPSATPIGAGYNHFVDVDLSAPITITGLSTWFYDQGVGVPVNPDQTGLTCDVNVYTCATSVIGNETTAAPFPATGASGSPHPLAGAGGPAGLPWSLAGRGSALIVAFPAESIITLTAPIVLAAGQHGICVEFLPPDPTNVLNSGQPNAANAGPLHALVGSPGALALPSDSFVTMVRTGFQNDAFQSGPVYADDINLAFNYDPDPNAGFWEPFGIGCYERPHAFWDQHAAGVPMPLANGGFDLFPSSAIAGPSYIVAPTSATYVAPNPAANLTTAAPGVTTTPTPAGSTVTTDWDDATITRVLPFTIQPPGLAAPTANLTIGSNGWIMFANNADPNLCFGYYNVFANFVGFDCRLAVMFGDLDPSAGGLLTYEDFGTHVTVTWEAVPEWSVAAAVNTMQVTIHANGIINVVYGAMNLSAAPGITGYTPGLGAPTPAEVDIATAMPFASGDGASPPILGLDARPQILPATPANLVTSNIPANTFLGLMIMDLAFIPGGFNLAPVGAPDCFQYVGANPLGPFLFLDASPVVGAPAAGGTMTLATPAAGAAFIGIVVNAQSATLTAGYNGFGALSSNALCFRIGT